VIAVCDMCWECRENIVGRTKGNSQKNADGSLFGLDACPAGRKLERISSSIYTSGTRRSTRVSLSIEMDVVAMLECSAYTASQTLIKAHAPRLVRYLRAMTCGAC
jgi:hypothetical protein